MILVTGSNGFVGKHLIEELINRNINYRAGVSKMSYGHQIPYGNLNEFKNWDYLLKDVTEVVHLSALVHHLPKKYQKEKKIIEEYRKVNVQATLNLANEAKRRGIKKFIFISTIKVYGEFSVAPFKHSDIPYPVGPYSISKHEAEIELLKLHEHNKFEIVIIRPPLVYGPGVKANFDILLKLINSQIPLPFLYAKNNKRSFISVYNLVDFIIFITNKKHLAEKIFLVSDDDDLSLKDLIVRLAKINNVKVKMFGLPISFIHLCLTIFGMKSYSNKLFGNLQANIEYTKNTLDWSPPFTLETSFSRKRIK